MGKLKIVSDTGSSQKQNQERGKLFEKLMSDVLRRYGYEIAPIHSVNYAGMEIDVEGTNKVTKQPLFAECKFYDSDIDAPKIQAFYGKYMSRWRKDPKATAIFIAIPGLNSHAKGFYKENIISDKGITFNLFEEDNILEAIFDSKVIVNEEVIRQKITGEFGALGDWNIIYSNRGWFWVQFIISPGTLLPKSAILFNGQGQNINDRLDIDYLIRVFPQLNDYEIKSLIQQTKISGQSAVDCEEIVEVRGSSECFEYQFPASPQFFVGRDDIIEQVSMFVDKVCKNEISSRGILFEAYSGWGKSSVVLACVERLRNDDHFAIAIDSRCATSSRFILYVVKYVFEKCADFASAISTKLGTETISGHQGVVKLLEDVSQVLKSRNKMLVIFFDQFENVFFKQEILKNIRDLFLKVCDKNLNIVFGFSWKTDLIGLMSEFPYGLRDDITGQSKKVTLDIFSERETNVLLDKLSEELRSSLRKDLRFFLSEYSQGYPWLLKKLCAHVKTQREKGVSQIDMATGVLNVETLFKEDMAGLTIDEEDALKRIAKLAPISSNEIGEEFRSEVVQPLIDRRLVVRISNKYDIYWDIFRDYLNSGKLPIQDNYILRAQIGSVLKVTKAITEEGPHNMSFFKEKTGLSEKSLFNVTKDMELLGIAKIENGILNLSTKAKEDEDIYKFLRAHLNERLKRNRLVQKILQQIDEKGELSFEEVAVILEKSCPYISATSKTWLTYARIVSDWLDAADLAMKEGKTISKYEQGTQIRERKIFASKRRGKFGHLIQYSPIESILVKMVNVAKAKSRRVDWKGFAKSTINKSLAVLEHLGFISRDPKSITINTDAFKFVENTNQRPQYFAEKAMKMEPFNKFVDILRENQNTGLSLKDLGLELKKRLDTDWATSTAQTNAKILMDWAKHAHLAPGIYSQDRRGKRSLKGKI